MEPDLWTFQGEVVVDDLQDFEVQASDGHIGKVDEATTQMLERAKDLLA